DVGHRDGADIVAVVADADTGRGRGIDVDAGDGVARGAEQVDAVVSAGDLDDRIGAGTDIGGDRCAGHRIGELQRMAAADQIDAVGETDAVGFAVGAGAVFEHDVVACACRIRRVEGRDRGVRVGLGAEVVARGGRVVDVEHMRDDADVETLRSRRERAAGAGVVVVVDIQRNGVRAGETAVAVVVQRCQRGVELRDRAGERNAVAAVVGGTGKAGGVEDQRAVVGRDRCGFIAA
ncbi:hypothetical protein chiPu_0030841, partial [Chiloscyllium punctatum]|nr:hypothetical protein [Chiloscyllium punctatum]